jgi:TRAP-type mannitol/chloroaromatic compound transport system substrate-binding protein
VLDAVGSGAAEMGHTAAFYWQGKEPAAAFFTTVPFGLTPNEHVAWIDAGGGQALGLFRFAPYYYGPGFNKPNGTGECIVALKAWQSLDAQLQAIAAHACAAEASFALAEMERLNIEALAVLTARDHVQVRTFPTDLVIAARTQSTGVLADLAGKSPGARKVRDAYVAFRDKIAPWSRISLQAVLEARQG